MSMDIEDSRANLLEGFEHKRTVLSIVAVVLGCATLALLVSTIVLAVQKAQVQDKLDNCGTTPSVIIPTTEGMTTTTLSRRTTTEPTEPTTTTAADTTTTTTPTVPTTTPTVPTTTSTVPTTTTTVPTTTTTVPTTTTTTT